MYCFTKKKITYWTEIYLMGKRKIINCGPKLQEENYISYHNIQGEIYNKEKKKETFLEVFLL